MDRLPSDLVTELERTFATTADARVWLDTPNAALQQRSPREVITTGESDRVMLMLYALNAGIPR